MTQSPRVINSEAMLFDAKKLMKERKKYLVVMEHDNVVGLIDIFDH